MTDRLQQLVDWAKEKKVIIECSDGNCRVALRGVAVEDSADLSACSRGFSGELQSFNVSHTPSHASDATQPPPAKRRRLTDDSATASATTDDSSPVVAVRVPRKMLLHPRFQWAHPTVRRLVATIKARQPTFFSRKRSQQQEDSEDEERSAEGEDEEKPLAIDPLFVVAIWFLIEELHNPASQWRQYLDLLPKEFDSSTYWSEETLEIIRGTNLFEGTKQINAVIDQIYGLIHDRFGATAIERRSVLWAYSIYASRSFCVYTGDIKLEGLDEEEEEQDGETDGRLLDALGTRVDESTGQITEIETHVMNLESDYQKSMHRSAASATLSGNIEPALLPLADIFNHNHNSKVRFINDMAREEFRLEIKVPTTQPTSAHSSAQSTVPICVTKGTPASDTPIGIWEVYNNYGPKSNEALLLSYGFSLLHNPHNTYWVQLGVSDDDPNKGTKVAILKAKSYPIRYDLAISNSAAIPKEMLASLRILLMDPRELYVFSLKETTAETVISWRNECQTLSTLASLLEARMKRIDHLEETFAEKRSRVTTDSKEAQHQILAQAYVLEQREILAMAIGNVERMLAEARANASALPQGSARHFLHLGLQDVPVETIESCLQYFTPKIQVSRDTSAELEFRADGPLSVASPSQFATADWILAENSPLSEVLRQAEDFPEDFVLAVWVAWERSKPTSAWASFWASLPPSFSNALYWTQEQLELISATLLLDSAIQLRERYQELLHYYASSIQPLLVNENQILSEVFTTESLKWAFSVVILNSLSTPQGSFVLLPWYGQFQFRSTSNWRVRFKQSDGETRPAALTIDFTPSADRTISSNYEWETSEDLVAKFGLVPPPPIPDSPFLIDCQSQAFITLNFSPEVNLTADSADPDQIMDLLNYFLLGTEHYIYLGAKKLPEKLLSTLRVLNLTGEEGNVLAQKVNDEPADSNPLLSAPDFISSRNEQASLELLTAVLNERLEQYSSASAAIGGGEPDQRILGLHLSQLIQAVRQAIDLAQQMKSKLV